MVETNATLFATASHNKQWLVIASWMVHTFGAWFAEIREKMTVIMLIQFYALVLSLSASTIHIGQTYFWSTNLAPALFFFSHQTTNQNQKKRYEFKSLAIYKRNRYSCEINILATSRFGMALKISDIFCLAATPKKGVVTLFAHRIFVHCAVADSPLLASVSLLFLPFKRIT